MNQIMESVFPEYIIEKTLKTSEHGNVFIVRHRTMKTRCIYREFDGNSEVYHKLQKVNSPYLPKIYEVEEQNGRVFVLEEYVTGDTLAFLLENGPLSLTYTKEIALQLCDALQILHGFNAVHRDVKPENIIIRGNEAVLIDFDASRLIKPENPADTKIMGTTGYAAPEQYGFSQTDARADIYSMGIVMNEMLTKQHPSKKLTESPLRPIIERCIEVNVDKRYFTVTELRSAIMSCQGTQKNKNRVMKWIGAAVLGLCGIGLLFGLVLRHDKTTTLQQVSETTAEGLEEEQHAHQVEIYQPQRMEIPEEQWQDSSAPYSVPFQYDLDGDGEKESYQFGVYQKDVPEGFQWTMNDQFRLNAGGTSQRRAYPAVWLCHEDGSLELAEEFAPLLTNTEIRVWRASDHNSPAPEVYTSEDYWTGGVQVVFTSENTGVWLYEIHATLDDQEFTAIAKSTVTLEEN